MGQPESSARMQSFPVKELSPYENMSEPDKNTSFAQVLPSSSNDSLQVPLSPQDSEDQTTPQAPRKFYMPKQTSVESTNSFSENDEMNENQAPMLRSIKEDPETTKKK